MQRTAQSITSSPQASSIGGMLRLGAGLALITKSVDRLMGQDDRASMALAAESMHGMTRVTPFVLPADVRDLRLRALQLDFEGGNQRVFRVYDDVARLSLQ